MSTRFHSGRSLLIAFTIAATVFGPSASRAQEKHKFTESNAAAQTKYTQQHVIEVGDVPDHQVRVYELRYTWPANPPTYAGVRAIEGWARGQSDYSSGNGRSWGYFLEVLENGDKIFFAVRRDFPSHGELGRLAEEGLPRCGSAPSCCVVQRNGTPIRFITAGRQWWASARARTRS